MPNFYTENYSDEYGRLVQLRASVARVRWNASHARERWSATEARVHR